MGGNASEDENHQDEREFGGHQVQHRLVCTVFPWYEHHGGCEESEDGEALRLAGASKIQTLPDSVFYL